MFRLWVSLLAFVFCGLAACATSGEQSSLDGQSEAQPTPQVGLPATDSSSGAAGNAELESTDGIPLEEAPPPLPTPDSLVGLSGESLKTLLGTPSLTTQEPPAQIWRYSLDLCTLFFFLYETAEDGVPTVRHVDVAVAEDLNIQPHLCLSGVSLTESEGQDGEATNNGASVVPAPAIGETQ